MKLSSLLLMVLAQFASCASFLCSVGVEDDLGPRGLAVSSSSVEDVSPLGIDEFVVAALTHPTGMVVTRIRANQEENVGSTPSLFPYDLSRSLFRTDEGWWFSRQGEERQVSSVFFVVSDGAIHNYRVNLPPQHRSVWIPIAGDQPRGLFVAVSDDSGTLVMHEVTPAGFKPAGTFPWHENGANPMLLNSRWSAEALSSGRIAVVSTGEADEETTMTVRVLAEAPIDTTFPCNVSIDRPLDTAVDDTGLLAIVGLSKKREVVGMVGHIDDPQSIRCRVISTPNETAARLPFGSPSIEWSGETFVAAWIRDDGAVRTCELRNLETPSLVISIGNDADVEHPLRQLVHRTADDMVFIWRARSGEIVHRSMAKSPVSHAVAMNLWRVFCRLMARVSTSTKQ